MPALAIVAYLRVSTSRQGRSGLGIEAQRENIARFAAAEGYEVVGEYVEVETGKGADALGACPSSRCTVLAEVLIQRWAMSKYFRPWNIDQTLLLPPNVQDFVPKGHVSRFIVELVRESLELERDQRADM